MTPTAFADAASYELFMGRWSRLLGEAYLEFAGVRDGVRVLDVGCGTGSLAVALLAATRPAEIVGVDGSAAFIYLARDRIRDPRVRFEVGDAQDLAFPPASFDWTAAMIVLNFVPDHARAAAEMRRVTRPGGLVTACVWDYGGGMTMLRRFWDAAVELDPAAASRHENLMPLCRPGELGELWRALGLQEIREGPIEIEMRFASFDDYWRPFLGGVGPGGRHAASLSAEKKRALEEKLRAELWNNEPEKARALPARAWAVAGVVP